MTNEFDVEMFLEADDRAIAFYRTENARLQAEVRDWKRRAQMWEAQSEKMTKRILVASHKLAVANEALDSIGIAAGEIHQRVGAIVGLLNVRTDDLKRNQMMYQAALARLNEIAESGKGETDDDIS